MHHTASVLLLASLSAAATVAKAESEADMYRVYIGTYTGGDSKGIYLLELDAATGKLTEKGLAGEAVNPSFLAIHPNRRFLYAVGEVNQLGGKRTGGVSAFAIDPGSGKLKLLNQQPSRGAGPCHIVTDHRGTNVLVANYGGGSVACLPVRDSGEVGEATAFVQHEGSSVNKRRQEGPHAHSINLDAAGRFAFVADLGLDKVLIYRFDPAKGTLTPNDPPSAQVEPGSGPRHFAFHPSGKFAYLINELTSTVTAFTYDAQSGALKPVQTISTLPEDFKGSNTTAEVQVHPSGKFVYGSNRGHDSIAMFAVDEKTGRLTFLGCEPTRGKTPRNFGIDPSGRILLAANQDSGNVVAFKIDAESGRL
ncbi:MAG TPA: lactonase family protein, partial [Gemmataceae bacterium]